MSADILRRAAALMRERAEAADDVTGRSWFDQADLVLGGSHEPEPADHIASWHPAVALAVADLLDHTAGADEQTRTQIGRGIAVGRMRAALAVARAYLAAP